MKPYFQNHSAGWLFLLVVICFLGMEIIQFFRQREWRKDATRIATPSFWVGVVIWVVGATAILHRAGHYWPGAAMGHGALVFAVGMVLLVAGAGLRWWSFCALGQYFTFTVDVSPDQQIVTEGPYRVLRHPGYAGGLLALIGIGVIYSNWIGLAGFALSSLAITFWRIHIEETALLRIAGDPYRSYAAHHKRLIPLIW
ncbi:MAG: methyltransferase family protein [Solirubrobacteraceae bacterium]